MTATKLNAPIRHRRSWAIVLKAFVRPSNYTGVLKIFALCRQPVSFLRRYVANTGAYPANIGLRTPIGPVELDTYSPDDIQTVNEIFFRGDYDCGKNHKIIVDFGSNIGISVIYFLTRNSEAKCYAYEPLAQNISRLKKNTKSFVDRVELAEAAVGEADGTVRFGWEPTGRYGGINRETGRMIEVPCRDSNAELARILEMHSEIDVLKVDIETMEEAVVNRITPEIACHIKHLVVEFPFTENPLAATHDMSVDVAITRFDRRILA
jgi:FkbM family methyltransferase